MSKNAVQRTLLITFVLLLCSGLSAPVSVSSDQEQTGVGTVIVESSSNFGVVSNGATYNIITVSTSTISNFTFSQSFMMISFNVTGATGTVGFCNITFSTQLLGGPYVILLNGSSFHFVETPNATHTSLYFTYPHSSQKVEIQGTTVISEYSTLIGTAISFTVLTLILMLTRGREKHYRTRASCR